MIFSIHHLNALLFIMAFPGMLAAQFAGGDGSPEDPWQIETIDELQLIAYDTTYLDKHFIQIADIDASETAGWNEGKGFRPIGDSEHPFEGIYDGNGHIITGLTINRAEEIAVGLFGRLFFANVRDLQLMDLTVHGNSLVGGLAGSIFFGSKIHRIGVSGIITADNTTVGGIAGRSWGAQWDSPEVVKPDIRYVYVEGKITGGSEAGGLVGRNQGRITDSYSTADVIGDRHAGGLVGFQNMIVRPPESGGKIKRSFSTGKVSGNTYVGGFSGHVESWVDRSYWDVILSGLQEASGRPFSDERHVSITGLQTVQMTGQDAYVHMFGLDFENIWQLTDGYPALRWQQPDNMVDLPEEPVLLVPFRPQGRLSEFIFPLDHLAYRGVPIEEEKTLDFYIVNPGNADLEGQLSLAGPGSETFEITVDGQAYHLAAGDSVRIQVTFRPDQMDTLEVRLEIGHNARNFDTPYVIKLTGIGLAATSAYDTDESAEHPDQVVLHPNYPNPFNPQTTIRYDIQEPSHVQLHIYDIKGRKIAVLVNETQNPGFYQVNWDASEMANGVYVFHLKAGEVFKSRQMLLLK